MRRGSFLLAVCALGCQLVIGTEDRPVDPVREGCALPTGGGARLRFGNLLPSAATYDLCVRSSGGDYGRPILRGGGAACPRGFAYGEVSAPFAVPEGRLDVKVVVAGSTCAARAAAELEGIAAPRDTTTSVLNLTGPTLRAFRDDPAQTATDALQLRIVHASNAIGALDFGFAASARLPVELTSPLLRKPIAFGEATNPETIGPLGNADANGYLSLPRAPVNLVGARTGEKRAVLAIALSPSEGTSTLYAIGDPTSPLYPVRGLLCDERSAKGLFTTCRASALSTLSVDVFNASLYGPAAQEEGARKPKIVEELSKRDSDVMCLAQIARVEDRNDVAAAAKNSNAFPYSVLSETNLDTAPSDPRDAPTSRTHPSCGGTVDPAKVDAALRCLTEKCSTTGGPDAPVSSTACMSSKCVSEMVALLVAGTDSQRCYTCIAVAAGSAEKLGDVRAHCTTDPRDYKGFRGQASSMILSRLPIRASETFVLPATSYQRVVQYAELEIESGKFLDYYCTNFTSPYGDLLAYSGFYAGGATGKEAWLKEAQLQATRTIELVKRKSAGRVAIVSGDFSASVEHKDPSGTVVIVSSNPQVIELLDSALTPAFPDAAKPECTECAPSINPYNTAQSTWAARTYLFGLPRTSALDPNVFFTDRIVPLSTGAVGPLSHSYAFNVRVLRPD